MPAPLPRPLELALRAALYVLVAFALCGMPLAMAGWFRPLPVALLTAAGTALLLRFASPLPASGRSGRGAAWVALAAVVLAAGATAFNVHFASEHVIADRDPGIYLWHGRAIANDGHLLVASSQRLFGPLVGRLPPHCPVACPGAPGGRLYVQFLHLFPLTLAAAAWIGGSALIVKANALLGGLALLAFFAFATRLVRPAFALMAMAALAVNLVEVHFARDTVSEVLAQALLFGGLYLLWRARESWSARAGLAAGLALGTTCIVRIDSFVYLIPLAAWLFAEWLLGAAADRRRFALAAGGGLALPAAIGFADLYFFSRSYFHLESRELRGVGIALAATLVVGGVALAARERLGGLARVRAAAVTALPAAIVVLALFAAFVRPHVEKAPLPSAVPRDSPILAQKQREQGLPVEPRRGYGEHSLIWVDWYLGPVALAAGVAGFALMSRRLVQGRAGPAAPFLGVFGVTALLYLWRPSIFPEQVWAMRRFLPVVIPGLLLLGAWTAERLFELRGHPALRGRGARLGAVAAAAVVVAGSIAVPLAELVPLRGERQQAGALAAMETICRALPPRAAVIAVKSPDVYRVVEPIHAFCRVPVGQVSPLVPKQQFARFAPLLRASGHRLALIATDRGALRTLLGARAPRRPLVTLQYRMLEQRLASRPKRLVPQRNDFYVALP